MITVYYYAFDINFAFCLCPNYQLLIEILVSGGVEMVNKHTFPTHFIPQQGAILRTPGTSVSKAHFGI